MVTRTKFLSAVVAVSFFALGIFCSRDNQTDGAHLLWESGASRDTDPVAAGAKPKRNHRFSAGLADPLIFSPRDLLRPSSRFDLQAKIRVWFAQSKTAPWLWLLSIRGFTDPIKWNELREQLHTACRFESTDDYVKNVWEWEGPDSTADFLKLAKVGSDPKLLQAFVDESKDRTSALIRLADQDPLRDWVKTADFFSKQDVPFAEKSMLLDRVLISWGKKEGNEYPVAWLEGNGMNGLELERSKAWIATDVYSGKPEIAVSLLSQINDRSLRDVAVLSIASNCSNINQIADLRPLVEESLWRQITGEAQK